MIYRSRMEIIAEILQAVSGDDGKGTGKTTLMYKAFLSYAQLKEYLSLLTERDLLQYDKVSQTFMITEKGRRFLKIYNQIQDVAKIGKFL
jgi:predicted transcriptional regulator